ncbi:tetratricopeptide repeat protein 36 homolog [Phlebotomus argentipes]|uniref:tetratricopeptide repeat protein 36 homolog n=1 Tax=Phlebotomus argentipes TaxID=94469 RepID=UPI002892F6EA|nr:tetratricopeptide repeat protein 36 homolog [Phlebotomus argentipes]
MPQALSEFLSDRDKAVLDSIFNPFQIGGGAEQGVDWNFDEGLSDDVQDPYEEPTPEVQESVRREIQAIKLAECGDLAKAVDVFSSAIEVAPTRRAPWNNRAQAYRLLGNDQAALADLEMALQLSGGTGRTGCRALCQRGLLHRKNGDDDAARDDFKAATNLGSKFARGQLIEMNPYAALCNQMLRDAFQKLS